MAGNLYSTIQAQEVNFPVPNTTQTVTIGTLKLGYQDTRVFWSWDEPHFNYAVGTWPDGNGEQLVHTEPTGDGPPLVIRRTLPNLGAAFSICNIENLNLSFQIDFNNASTDWAAWKNLPNAAIEIHVGNQVQTVSTSTTEVTFSNVTDTNPAFSIVLIAGVMDHPGTPPSRSQVPCLLPMQITWQIQAAGAMTIPAIPVALIYAPVVDAQRKNTSANSTSQTIGNVSSFSLVSQQSQQHPIASAFQSTMTVKNDMAAVGSVLSKIPIPWVAAIGAALSVIATGLGTASATETDTASVTSQNTLALTVSKTSTVTAEASEGGPGVGDVLIYLKNVQVVWYSNNGQMALALLGFGSTVQATVGQLKTARVSLQGLPAGTLDTNWGLSSDTLDTLLSVDPFVSGGPTVDLPAPRFVLSDDGVYEVGGGSKQIVCSHTITTSDLASTASIQAESETDSPGFLSFLGIGITEQKTVSWQVAQSSSSQVSNTTTYTSTYLMNGDADEHYAFEAYFDTIFGTYAFKSVPVNEGASVLSGVVKTQSGGVLANEKVTVSQSGKKFSTYTDADGQYAMRLPGVSSGKLQITALDTTYHVDFKGKPITMNLGSLCTSSKSTASLDKVEGGWRTRCVR